MPVTIDDAKRIAYDRRQLGVLVLAFDGKGSYTTASFGMTRELCAAMRLVNEDVADAIEGGTVTVPDCLVGVKGEG